MANVNTTMGFQQAASLLNSIVSQATGKTSIAATTTDGFVSQAQTTLLTVGVDPIMNAISQVISKTIFSVRPYNARFKGLQRDAVQWGNHVRKISFGSGDVTNDDRRNLTDGQSVDMQTVCKPSVLQTNFYSFDTYQNCYTIFRDQLNTAFTGADEFMRFVSGIVTEVSNKLESFREGFARATMLNLIGATSNLGRARHLVTEYAEAFDIDDADTVLTEHFDSFVKWVFAEIKVLSDRFTERSEMYQTNITGYDIYRHTPKEYQRLYMYSPFLAQVDARVLAATFNPEYLALGDRESVSFWQSIETPSAVKVTPSQIVPATGAYAAGNAVNLANVLGVLMDYEAAGITQMNEWSAPAPFNARGGYTTTWYHVDMRGWNDCTEKAVVLLLD